METLSIIAQSWPLAACFIAVVLCGTTIILTRMTRRNRSDPPARL